MKIREIADVVQHPAAAKEVEFTALLQADESSMDDIVEFIMDDNNAEGRRLYMLRHLDELHADVQDKYDEFTLEDFMFNMEGAPLTSLSPEEAENFKKDMGIPPYHLSVVEQEDKNTTGEYEVCQTCGGEGTVYWDHTDEWSGDHVPASADCPDCEQGLKDITGLQQIPDLDNT